MDERMTTKSLTKAALAVKRKNGEKTGGIIPFGFDAVDGQLVENMNEQKTIKRIKQLRAQGCSYQRIADTLNADRAFTKTGKPWSFGTVANILKKAA